MIQNKLSSFIGEKLLEKEIESLKIILSKNSLSKIIKNEKFFQKDGAFSRTEYEKFLITNGLSAVTFEKNMLNQSKKKQMIGFVSGGTGSYSPSLMNLQLDVLEQDFKILPNIVIAYVDQTDIGDENCRYKNHKFFENGVLKSIRPESHLMWRDTFNYSEIYEKSKISLKNNYDPKKKSR